MLEKFNFSVDPKNIGYQNIESYKAELLIRIEDLISRMRWKLYFTLESLKKQKDRNNHQSQFDNDFCDSQEIITNNYGFRTTKSAPAHPLLKPFEDDLFSLIQKIEMRRYTNNIQEKIKQDISRLGGLEKVLIQSDKTSNWQSISMDDYKKSL